MKRILALWLAALMLAAQPIQAAVCVGFGQSSASSCMSGTYTFAWTGDFPSDTDKACSSSGDSTGVDGTLTGTTISTSYGESSSYGMIIDSANDYIAYSTSGDVNVDPSVAQTIWMRVYISANPTQNTEVFKACGSSDCSTGGSIYIRVNSNGDLFGQYSSFANYSASKVATGSWIDIAYTYDPVNQDHDITHNGTNWSEDVNEITSALTTDTAAIFIGNRTTSSPSANTIYIDKIAVVNGYRAAKPTGW